MAGWYFSRNGQNSGPYSSAQLQQLAATGQLSPTDLVWKEGMQQWLPATSIKGLFAKPSSPVSPAPPCPGPAAETFAFDSPGNEPPATPSLRVGPRKKDRTLLYLAAGGGALLLVIVTVVATLLISGFFSGSRKNGPQAASSPGDKPGDKPAERPGKLRATVTWKFNDFVGNKPDTGSVVLLIPKDFRGKLDTSCIDPLLAKFKVDGGRMDDLTSKAVYLGIVGGDGKVTISGVKPGSYRLIIVSANTRDDPDAMKGTKAILKPYFEGDLVILGGKKVHFAAIQIISGEEAEVSHDFGLTFF